MQLLSLAARNHRSFSDEFSLVLDKSKVTESASAKGSGGPDNVHRVVMILGANGSGKSNVIKAGKYIAYVLRSSASGWGRAQHVVRNPFVFDPKIRESTSAYELQFLLPSSLGREKKDGDPETIRYRYFFEISDSGFGYECLESYPPGGCETIFDRDEREDGRPVFMAPEYGPVFDVIPSELLLSRAYAKNSGPLYEIAKAIIGGLEYFDDSSEERDSRLDSIIDSLMKKEITPDHLVTLAKVADIGICSSQLHAKKMTSEQLSPEDKMAVLKKILSGGVSPPEDRKIKGIVSATVNFRHYGAEDGDEDALLNLGQESSGTLAWLAFSVPMINTLRNGGVLFADELDSSLHPNLTAQIIDVFQDPEINQHGAQLIFTTHNASLLRKVTEGALSKDQVWFTEKDRKGQSSLYCLADFDDIDDTDDLAQDFIEGKLGSYPHLVPALLKNLVEETDG